MEAAQTPWIILGLSSAWIGFRHLKIDKIWRAQVTVSMWITALSIVKVWTWYASNLDSDDEEGKWCIRIGPSYRFCFLTGNQLRLDILSDVLMISAISSALSVVFGPLGPSSSRMVQLRRNFIVQRAFCYMYWVLGVAILLVYKSAFTDIFFQVVHALMCIVNFVFAVVMINVHREASKASLIIPMHWYVLSKLYFRVQFFSWCMIFALLWNCGLFMWLLVTKQMSWYTPEQQIDNDSPILGNYWLHCLVTSIGYLSGSICLLWYHFSRTVKVRRIRQTSVDSSLAQESLSPLGSHGTPSPGFNPNENQRPLLQDIANRI